MILPTTTWAIAAAVCAASCAVVASLWWKIKKDKTNEQKRSEANAEYVMAEIEVSTAVRGGDANRVRRAHQRLRLAALARKRYGAG